MEAKPTKDRPGCCDRRDGVSLEHYIYILEVPKKSAIGYKRWSECKGDKGLWYATSWYAGVVGIASNGGIEVGRNVILCFNTKLESGIRASIVDNNKSLEPEYVLRIGLRIGGKLVTFHDSWIKIDNNERQ